jgi:ethanolamine utilization protein EutA
VPVTIKSLVFSEDPRSHGKSDPADWHAHADGALHKHEPAGRHHGHGHGHDHGHDHAQGHGHSRTEKP